MSRSEGRSGGLRWRDENTSHDSRSECDQSCESRSLARTQFSSKDSIRVHKPRGASNSGRQAVRGEFKEDLDEVNLAWKNYNEALGDFSTSLSAFFHCVTSSLTPSLFS